MKVINEGSPTEGVTMFCQRHGCSLVRRLAQVRDQEQLLEWFERGQQVPEGNTPALKRRHGGLAG